MPVIEAIQSEGGRQTSLIAASDDLIIQTKKKLFQHNNIFILE